ncbi:response regulator [Mucilaginibacter endophyticus]|uniref:response regulator n=1 Tax=Mucilaginibacter endophyticus TaxID=2675003 RepID=UPI00137AD914|nr:response regulator [Mucilaginibacter endophyticus]
MKKKIIVVDDDDDILQIIRYVLEEHGMTVEAVSDIVAFQKLCQNTMDLILLDDWLNDGLGSQLCKNLKNNAHTANVPIILISAANNLAASAKESGADDFLSKPFDIEDLLTKVDFWLYEKVLS